MKVISIILLSFLCVLVKAQDKPSEKEKPVQFNQHPYEIGIDFQNLFTGQLGTALVFKKRIGEKTFISLNRKKVLRLRIGGNGRIPLEDSTGISSFSPITVSSIFDEHYSVFAFAGIEWQVQKKRVQYFYGFETGYRLAKTDFLSTAFTTIQNNTLYDYGATIVKENSFSLAGIGGVKFFITPEFSVALETSLTVSYLREKVIRKDLIPNGFFDFSEDEYSNSSINYTSDYLNALYLSYYF